MSECKANPDNELTFGSARFQFLTGRLVRMEWSEDQSFEDRPSLSVSNRAGPVVAVQVQQEGKKITLSTDHLTIRFKANGKPFSAKNLSVEYRMTDVETREWKPGQERSGNLGGTVRTLSPRHARCHLGACSVLRRSALWHTADPRAAGTGRTGCHYLLHPSRTARGKRAIQQ